MQITSWLKCAAFAVAAVVACLGAEAETSRGYVRDGLVAMWDGHENSGAGLHRAEATTWVDLVGGVEIDLPDWVSVEDHSLYSAGGTSHVSVKLSSIDGLSSSDAAWTIEIVQQSCGWTASDNYMNLQNVFNTPRGTVGYRQDNAKGFYFFGPSSATKCSLQNWVHATAKIADLHTMSAVVGANKDTCSIWMDGVKDTVNYNAGYDADRGTAFSFFGNLRMSIRVYAIRVYNRKLTQEEVAANRAIDVTRFVNGDYTGADRLYVSGTPDAYGEVTPAYGAYEGYAVGQSRTCLAPAAWTNAEETIAVACIGYKVYTNDAVYVEGSSNSFTYEHPDCETGARIVWQWARQYKVAAAAGAGGGVSVEEEIVGDGDIIEIAATANAGYGFVEWTGNVPDEQKRQNPLMLKVDGVKSVTANFAEVGRPATWTGAGEDALASNPANWEGGVAPKALAAVILDGNSAEHPMTWDLDIPLQSWTQAEGYTNTVKFMTGYDPTGFFCLTVNGDVDLQGGSWTHPANSGTTPSHRINVAVGGNMTIGPKAKIDASKVGYTGYKHGGGKQANNQGGSYGSRGSCNSGKIEVWPYGCYYAPEEPGTSGTWGYNGGGAVKLTVAGTLTHNGVIDVNGDSVHGTGGIANNYDPSGGAIYIIAGEIEGAGTLLSQSHTGSNNGSGGRIAVKLTKEGADFSNYDIVSRANASSRRNSASSTGAPGSIYAETAADEPTHGWYIVRGNGYMPDNANRYHFPFTPEIMTLHFAKLTITNNMYVCVDSGCTLDLTGTEVICADKDANRNGIFTQNGGVQAGSAPLASTGTILVDSRFVADYDVVTTCGWAPETDDFVLEGRGRYILRKGTLPATLVGNLCLNGASTYVYANKALTVGGDVVVSNGIVRIDDASSTPYPLTLNVGGDLTVCEQGTITVAGLGYPSGVGPVMPGTGGASHGGQGLNGSNQPSPSVPYGSVYEPVTAGTGSSNAAGGGILALTVGGTLTNDGLVTAAGGSYNAENRAAGGSVNVRAAALRGKGVFSVDASDNTASTKLSRGAGGRIAVRLTGEGTTFDDFAADGGEFRAAGANRQKPALTPQGGAGTIYLQVAAQAENEGTLIVDNGGCTGASQPTTLGGGVEGLLFDQVVILGGGNLGLAADMVLGVKGGWDCSGTFSGGKGSVVDFTGALPLLVSGTTTFANVSCTTAGKEISFADGAKVTVTENFKTGGQPAAHVVLKGADADARWTLDSSAGGAILSSTDVYNCDSVADIVVMGGQGSGNSGTVSFVNVTPGETITWTGAKSSAWGDAGNWTTVHDGSRVPVESDNVVIPGGTANNPVLSVSASVTTLTMGSADAALSLGASTLEVTGRAEIAGTVSATTGGFTFDGDVVWSGAFDRNTSTVTFRGTEQSFSCAVPQFYNLKVLSGALAVVGDIDCAGTLTVGDGKAAASVTFGENARVKVLALDVPGTADAQVTLACAKAHGTWNLNASKSTVSHAIVSGSDAAKGVAVVPTDSQDAGDNVNWFFVDTRTHYAGGALPALDATTDLVVDEGVTLTFAADAVVKSLTVSPDAAVTVPNAVTLEVKGSVTLENDATLSWNSPGAIGGNLVILAGAKLTHDVNAKTQTNQLDLEIGGDGYVAAEAAVDCEGKGISTGVKGEYGTGTGDNCGKTHGGRGMAQAEQHMSPSYGSILNPVTVGTGADWGIGGIAGKGGGAIRLVFKGALTLDGDLNARSGYHTGSHYAPSGGSVNLTCAHLSGAGGIWADAYGTVANNFPGGGGRVAVRLTEQAALAPYTGLISAYGGYCANDWKTYGSAGTYYLETAADQPGSGTVIIQNKENAYGARNTTYNLTDVPSTRINDTEPDRMFHLVSFAVHDYATMNLTRDLSVADLDLSRNGYLKLNGHTLRVNMERPKSWPKGGALPSNVIPGGTAAAPGKIVWKSGLVFLLR